METKTDMGLCAHLDLIKIN